MAKKKAFGIPKMLSDGIGETIKTGNNNIGRLLYEIVELSSIDLDHENPRDFLIDKNDVMNGVRAGDIHQERKTKEIESLQTLSFSIKKAGVRNPIELYRNNGRYTLISGERRVLSSLLAGKTDIPAKVLDSKPDELQLRFLQWIENIEREDLNIWERLQNIEQIINAYSSVNNNIAVESGILSEIIGCSQKQSKRYLDVLSVPDTLKHTLKEKGISDLIKLSLIANVKDKDQQLKLIEEAVSGASRSDLNATVQNNKRKERPAVRNSGVGRPRTSISLSIPMEKISAIRIMVDHVLESNSEYTKHKHTFHRVDWNDANQIKKAFHSFLGILENSRD